MLRPCRKQVRLTGRKEHLAGGGVTTVETDQLCDFTKLRQQQVILACASQKEEESKQAKDVYFFTSHKQRQILKCFGRIWDLNSNPPLAD